MYLHIIYIGDFPLSFHIRIKTFMGCKSFVKQHPESPSSVFSFATLIWLVGSGELSPSRINQVWAGEAEMENMMYWGCLEPGVGRNLLG